MSLIKTWCKKALRGCFATAAISSVLLLTACGDDSSSSGPNNNASREVVAVKNKSISGVSQKGPFVSGSVVKLYELDGESYAQTGKNFTGKITSDDGKFSISSVSLASQYALLEANGYFRNEIMGNKSQSTITLNALTDLSDRKTVNINLLTHLEYERALYLMREGKDMSSAKKQAEAEILNAFGIKGEFASSEDLDIFSKGDGNAALLAFSVLMLRDLSEADLTELLTKFATDIEKDGVWDDDLTIANVADWAAAKDLEGVLPSIRSNIENWKLGTVPEFEKYVRNFWYTNYGLGVCGSSNKAEVLAVKNERSSKYGTQVRFICKNGAWNEATALEKDTYKWNAGKDGEIRIGDVTGEKYKYSASLDKWMGLKEGWSWDVPKEDRLNPEISYGVMTDIRDGQTYKTVKIGDQVWMAENLNYYDASFDVNYHNSSECYRHKDELCAVAGRLYTWAVAIDSVKLATDADNSRNCGYGKSCASPDGVIPDTVYGVCPPGWHLPAEAEWKTLIEKVGGVATAGKALKSQTGWYRGGNGTDAYGFSALPVGYGDYHGFWDRDDFSEIDGASVDFWSATESGDGIGAYAMKLMCISDKVYLESSVKYDFFSVRCLKDL